jgi:hypothetical protein
VRTLVCCTYLRVSVRASNAWAKEKRSNGPSVAQKLASVFKPKPAGTIGRSTHACLRVLVAGMFFMRCADASRR